ncbi:serine/threonine protein kinase [Microbacterium testaceum StLB037]|uniref:non-specific serine/threonine protein kinase n=2 Tax=Microbacterium TaxID=33882 RepID=A0A1H0Q7R9_MICTS|nr:PASTA domain-containing protein [Microbacterium testaceum]SDP13075.1 serine/threonine protein kinase [Microbacterium testaceum StLB037]
MVDDAGGLVAGRFRVEGLLGTGGTASVFRARDEVTGQTVAVKLLHPHLSQSDTVREAFLREGRRTAHVSHPTIVAVVDMGTFREHGIPIAWIAQQIVEGVTLAEHVRATGPLSAVHAAAVAGDILDALGAAHAVGLVHRDVSPANVLVHVVDNGLPRSTLLDFGLADAAGETAHGDDVLRSSVSPVTAGVVGNAEFASPEQLSGQPVGPRGDLYQVGGMLYFALTGRAPFTGSDRSAVIRAHLHAPPPVPSVAVRSVPGALDRVVVRSMLKEPADRFADAAEMRAAVLEAVTPARVRVPGDDEVSSTRVLAAAPLGAGSAPAPAPVDESTRHGPRWGAIAAIVLLLAGTAAAVPLMANAGRAAPAAEPSAAASAPVPTATTTSTPQPTASDPGTPAPIATALVPAFGSLDDTRLALAAAGFVVGDITERDAPQSAGTVLSSDPAPGTAVARGSAVRLVVASGSNLVPNVVGMDAAAAASSMRAAGFVPAQTTVASDRPMGTVVGVEPAAGSAARLGSAVTILVAAARATPTPAPPSPSSTPTPVPTATPTGGPR